MRNPFLIILAALCMTACKPKQVDPVVGAPVFPLQLERFDSAFFNMDTTHTKQSVDSLLVHYPNFTTLFLTRILMLKSVEDTAFIKAFYSIYKPVYVASQKVNAIQIATPLVADGLRRFHFYFPKYTLSNKLTLFVGPFEQFANVLTKDAIAIGLQMHLGNGSSWYSSEQMQTMYPIYMSSKFTPNQIPVRSLENILNDMSPLAETGNLLSQLVETGKRQYILKTCLPGLADTVLLGYSDKQLKALSKEESKIWEYIVAEKLIYSNSDKDINAFMNEGAENEIFGEAFPGNVGKYIGYKIVAAWMQQKPNDAGSLQKLMETPAQQIFNEAKYAP